MRASVLIGAVLIAGGAAVAGFGATRPAAKPGAPVGPDPAVTGVEAKLDTRLAEARATLEARVAELAAKPPVQGAVATDVATTGNMSYADLMFEPREREIVELGQDVGGKVTSLSVLPATAPRSRHLAEDGLHVGAPGGELAMTAVGPVAPADRKGELTGRIAVTMILDLAAETAPLRERGLSARIETPDGAVQIGPPFQTAAREQDLGAGLATRLVTPAAGGAGGGSGASLRWLLWVGIAGGALGLVLLVAGLRRAPARVVVSTTPTAVPPVNIHGQTVVSAPPPSVNRGSARVIPRSDGTDPNGGPIFGRYQLVKKLGSGGMADVFLARAHGEAGFSKQVALKLLHSHLASRPQAMAHFLDEARLASNLDHPNIVHVIDLGKVDDDYFIAMEYIEGSDLERVIALGRAAGRHVPLPIAMTILRRICDGLDAAHRALGPDGVPLQLVHRDVKSGNVLVSRQGQVKISDFGIAKASSQVHTTQIGETKGTPSVMAPEQRMGQVVDLRADVYAVAALGYELFTSAEMNLDLVQLAQLGIEGWPHLPRPSEVRADLPRELDAVLLGALAFAPEARPASCHDLEEQLGQIAARYNLSCSDKDIARWLQGELAQMPAGATGGGPVSPASPPPVGLGA